MRTAIFSLAVGFALFAPAQSFTYNVSTAKPDCLYRCGETAVFTVTVLGLDGHSATAGTVSVSLDNFGPAVQTNATFDLAQANPFQISGSLKEPGFLRLCLPKTATQTPSRAYDGRVQLLAHQFRHVGRHARVWLSLHSERCLRDEEIPCPHPGAGGGDWTRQTYEQHEGLARYHLHAHDRPSLRAAFRPR